MSLSLHIGLCLALGLSTPLIALATVPPRAGAPLLVIAPPWHDLPALIEGAGGRPIGPSAAPLAQLALSDDPDFGARLRAAGAWILADGQVAARICGVAT